MGLSKSSIFATGPLPKFRCDFKDTIVRLVVDLVKIDGILFGFRVILVCKYCEMAPACCGLEFMEKADCVAYM